MKATVFSVTEKGRILSKKFSDLLPEHTVSRFTFYKHSDNGSQPFTDMKAAVGTVFDYSDIIIFICACGIAVRSIAPFIKSKQTDPAVLVIDDNGKFVVSLLSGHIGGANSFTREIAHMISAEPVVTTATDIGGKFSPDSFAKANDLIITDMNAAKLIASAVLDNEKIGFISEYGFEILPDELEENQIHRCGIYIGTDDKKPFEVTLKLIPKNVVLGIGCKKNTPLEVIEKTVRDALENNNIPFERVCSVVTIDIKSDEKGLLDLCEKYTWDFSTYSSEELMSIDGDFTSSDFVKSITGADNICERSCAIHTENGLIFKKYAENGVTVAASEKQIKIDFEKEFF